MKIRCKFRLTNVTSNHYRGAECAPDGKWNEVGKLDHTLTFTAVTGGQHASEENKTFWKYTPAGELKVSSTSGEIADAYAKMIGQEFYLDITPAAEVPAPGATA
jgi:hypothetical protein